MHTRRALFGLVAVLAMGCASTVPPSSSLPTASPAPASAPLPTASPSRSPVVVPSAPSSAAASPQPFPLTLLVPDPAVHVLPSEQPWATYGSLSIGETPFGRSARVSLTMSDLATRTTVTLATLAKGHALAQVATTADRVVWVEIWRDHPSPSSNQVPGCVDAGKPLRWKVAALVIATRKASTLASGTNVRTAVGGECADVNPPVIGADADRVAYTLEAASPAHPVANRIVVRSLLDGTKVRSVTSTGLVRDLLLDGQAIAYRDNTNVDRGSGTVYPFDGRLMAIADDAAAPTVLDEHVRAAGLGGGRLAWIRGDATDGSMWTAMLGSDQRLHVTGFVAPDFTANGADQIDVSGAVIAWTVTGLAGDINTSRLAAWLNGDPSARYVAGFLDPDYVGVSGGWLVWDATLSDPGVKWPAGLYGMPITDLPAQ